jgi:hypothetical protein
MATAQMTLPISSPRILAIGPLAVLSLGAAAIHFAVMPEHFAEWWAFGLFFAAIGWFEALWAVGYVTIPSRGMAALGLLVNAGTVLLWAASRTTGLPIGPEPWVPEAIGVPGVTATILELLLVLGLAAALAAPRVGSSKARPTIGMMTAVTLGVSVLIAVATTLAIAISNQGMG